MKYRDSSARAERMAEYYFSRDSSFGPLVYYGQADAVSEALTFAEKHFRAANPDARILRLTAEQFKEEFIQQLRGGDLAAWISDLGKHDLLLLEGFEKLAATQGMQQEIYRLLDHLYEHGRRTVIGMSLPPKDVLLMEDRVRTQLEGGLLWGLSDDAQ